MTIKHGGTNRRKIDTMYHIATTVFI